MTAVVVIGASIISHLAGLLEAKGIEKTIAAPGLSFDSKKMRDILVRFRNFCVGKKVIKVGIFPLGNSMFPGRPRGPCYLRPRQRPLIAVEMMKKTLAFIKELRASVESGTELSFVILPSLGRRPGPCREKCTNCICYAKFGKKAVKYEKMMLKVKDSKLSVIKIQEFSEYIIKHKRTNNKTIKRLRKLMHQMKNKTCTEIRGKNKLFKHISGVLLNCPAKLKCERDPKRKPDKIHLCCNYGSETLAGFISQCLA